MAEESGERQSVNDAEITRRGFMFRFGLLFNAVAAGLLALPIIGYVASTLIYRDWQQWIELGPVDRFPEGQTRLATYRNPFHVPWSGKVALSASLSGNPLAKASSLARMLGGNCRVAGSRNFFNSNRALAWGSSLTPMLFLNLIKVAGSFLPTKNSGEFTKTREDKITRRITRMRLRCMGLSSLKVWLDEARIRLSSVCDRSR